MKRIRMIALLICAALLLFPTSVMADAAIGGEHNYQDVDYYVVVDAPDGYVNFRYGPGLEYGINFPIYNGEILHVTGTMDNYYDGLLWGQAEYGGNYGWFSINQTSWIQDPYAEPATQAAPAYEGVDQYNMVDAWDGYCNLRTGPGIAYAIITPIYNGETLHVTMRCYNPEDDLYWGYTVYKGSEGWISLSQTTQVAAPQPETQPVTVVTPSFDTDQYLVNDAYYLENADYMYSIPAVNLESADILAVNAEIYNDLYPQIQSALEKGLVVGELLSSTYSWNLNGDILSLVIFYRYGGPWHEYKVYNISVSGKRLVNDTAVIGAAGYTESEYSQMARSAMEQKFISLSQLLKDRESEMFKTAYDRAYNETLSQDNIAASMPFLNAKGDLCIIANIGLIMMQNSSSWEELDLVTPYSEDENQDFYATVKSPSGYTGLKTEAGPSGSTILSISNGQKIFISSIVQYGGDGTYWGDTYYNGKHGWIPMNEASR